MVSAQPSAHPIRPYASFALSWWNAGWSPLPLPPRKKAPVPEGFTGYDGAEPTKAQIRKWIKECGDGNIAIRMPVNVIGIDVDAYKDKHGDATLAELEDRYGELPPTIRTTARGQDSPSGIRWFRIREGAKFPGVLGPGIEVIQYFHRYAVAPGSWNPSSRSIYAAFDDRTGDEVEIFRPDDLAILPESWYEVERAGDVGAGLDKSQHLPEAEIRSWLDSPAARARMCRAMRNVLAREVEALEAAVSDGLARYDTGRDGSMALVRLAAEGHLGASRALSKLKAAYLRSLEGENDRDPEGEWRRMVTGAVEAVAGHEEGPHAINQCPDRPVETENELWPSPRQPRRVAQRLVTRLFSSGEARTLVYWRGDFYEWTGAHHRVVSERELTSRIDAALADASYLGANGNELEWSPAKASKANLVDSLADLCWRQDWAEPDISAGGAALIPFRNGVLELDRRTGERRLIPHAPERFLLSSLPFEYRDDFDSPGAWLKFLDSLEIDQEVCDLLQEWFGYVVSGDSSKHKFLYLLGPTRAGKGVITRTLQSLVGASNYASPNLAQFGTNFGLQPTIGKSLITINDARFRGVRSAELVERLLNFTGGDSMTIDRKNREPWEGRPTARVMVVSNDPPSVTGEQTTAFARRILGPIELHRSFYDNEDYELEDRIAGELDAIMGWALDGYARLVARGRFVRPAASAELFREIEEAMSPVLAFVRDRCVHSPNHIVGKDQLYAAYKRWCADSGTYCASKVEFGRQLKGTLRDKVQWVKLPREAGKPRGNGWRGIRVIGAEYEL